MKPEIKEKWVKALRSGEYIQGRSMLHPGPERWCCLGVLTDIYAKENNISWQNNPYGEEGTASFQGEFNLLPSSVYRWAGLAGSNPAYEESGAFMSTKGLAELNDAGVSFTKIADIIEKEF